MWRGSYAGQVLSVREMEYVEAARRLGYVHGRILFRHVLPNVMGPVTVVAASNFASAIVIEAGLSFLGVGVQPPQPSWGLMIKENYNFIITNNPMLALAPGFADHAAGTCFQYARQRTERCVGSKRIATKKRTDRCACYNLFISEFISLNNEACLSIYW